MSTTSKTKWVVSIIVCGILLVLAGMGGNWGTTYAANDITDYNPIINFIVPNRVIVGSLDKTIFISGTNFGDSSNTAVRIMGNGTNEIFYGLVTPTGIWVNFPARLFVTPLMYDLTVVMSNPDTLPTIPITPWDVESKAVLLDVFEGYSISLPVVLKSTISK